MIRIARPPVAPEVLRTRGAAQTAADSAAHEAGQRDFTFDPAIYNGTGVKDELVAMQSGKCAFCESLFLATGYGDVEHYRPKGCVAQAEPGPITRPGYYWLAYDWENLLLACQICNQSYKRNLFPLKRPSRRARSHRDDLLREEPLLLNPATHDPRGHIRFHDEQPAPVRRSRMGRVTIGVAGLCRAELLDRRRRYLDLLRPLRDLLSLYSRMEAGGTLTAAEALKLVELRGHVAFLTGPQGEYSAMARDFFTPR